MYKIDRRGGAWGGVQKSFTRTDPRGGLGWVQKSLTRTDPKNIPGETRNSQWGPEILPPPLAKCYILYWSLKL